MKIKTLAAICFFIMVLFATNSSMAQSIVPTTRNIEMREGDNCDTEVTVYQNGCRLLNRTYTSSDPNIVVITEVMYYELTSGVIKWLFKLMGKRCGLAVITTVVTFIDEFGNDVIIQETIRVSVKWDIDLRQALPSLTGITSADAIKEED